MLKQNLLFKNVPSHEILVHGKFLEGQHYSVDARQFAAGGALVIWVSQCD